MSTESRTVEETCRQLETYFEEAVERTSSAENTQDLNQVRIDYLGKKGKFSAVLTSLKDFSADDRRQVGQLANKLRTDFEAKLSQKTDRLSRQELNQKLNNDTLDTTAPGVRYPEGRIHPIRRAMREAIFILERAGLKAAYGPDIEHEDYCFDRLNFKPGHAARDMQATFFIKTDDQKKLVLRTHTSPVQVRVMLDSIKEKNGILPIRVQAPGRVYRMDDDRTHSPMFHQIEGLVVDTYSTMGDLHAVLDFFCREFFGEKTKVRFRPSYFPFVEPGAEVDISCVFCHGGGCRVCSHSGWIEIAGAGLVHPEVFKACGFDPDKVQGWAFGVGVERLAMLKYGIDDLRLYFENRLSFLRGGPTGEA